METLELTDLITSDFSFSAADFPDLAEEPDSPPLSTPPSRLLRSQPAPTSQWDPRLVLDLAIGVDEVPDILTRYSLTEPEYQALSHVPSFRKELAMALREVRENGVSFNKKARVQAESYLMVLDNLVYGDDTPHSVRLDAIKSTVKWAGLEPKEDKNKETQAAPQINVQINF